MKIGIISDSHDDIESIDKAIDLFNQNFVTHVFHAGDYIFPGIIARFQDLKKEIKFYGVRGNNDGELLGIINQFNQLKNAEFLNEFGRITLQDKEIGIYHGTNRKLVESLQDSQIFDVLILGHTHIKMHKKYGRTIIINPGTSNKMLNNKAINENASIVIFDINNNQSQFTAL